MCRLPSPLHVSPPQAGRSMHSLDAILPAPFARLHHIYCRQPPEHPAPFSCMAGLTVPLVAARPGGALTYLPYKMKMRRREVSGRDPITLAVMEEMTMEQVRG